ncbi:TetR/AcrR family transcriptional regulator C-terminal domain-containing protein [Nocardia asteroides]|uniref:TetR/AcrR family transcriptional regulator C-terminal domain-containing protein n=1 Tax=Nocardia asteroides TaxID=1824 RepID=UPI001E3E76E2|nr:TetR/AcrR family transcriptional regulator C-terminal domain-containing protein [Nocardia asteroides]UGT62527.1 TetR/AcrR family transcriptional regulator C-terminal domain-containing protein [Nocardia asteroides]
MAKRATPVKRQRRERGSLNPDDIIQGAFELAEEVSIDGLSMPLLGKHLDVGVTSIYWYFRKKDDLLNAMTDRALSQYAFAAPFVEADHWRETLRNHARTMRETFLGNPILCDLILIRSALSRDAARLGAQGIERAINTLVKAGFSVDDAFDLYSAINLHVRGSVVLQRLYDKNKELDAEASAYYEDIAIEPETTPLLAEAMARGRRSGAPDDRNFEYGLECILDHASRVIAGSAPAAPAKKAPAKAAAETAAPAKAPAKKTAAKRSATKAPATRTRRTAAAS